MLALIRGGPLQGSPSRLLGQIIDVSLLLLISSQGEGVRDFKGGVLVKVSLTFRFGEILL